LLLAAILPLVLFVSACADEAKTPAGNAATQSAEAQALARGSIVIDFSGAPAQREKVTLSFSVPSGRSAWLTILQALGPGNVSYKDFGGDLGIFITGFYGVEAQGNHFWEFLVNGESSEKGVSAYKVRDGDRLEFRYASF
jgi:hypothetical protein